MPDDHRDERADDRGYEHSCHRPGGELSGRRRNDEQRRHQHDTDQLDRGHDRCRQHGKQQVAECGDRHFGGSGSVRVDAEIHEFLEEQRKHRERAGRKSDEEPEVRWPYGQHAPKQVGHEVLPIRGGEADDGDAKRHRRREQDPDRGLFGDPAPFADPANRPRHNDRECHRRDEWRHAGDQPEGDASQRRV
jgi:hypothetical protein